MSRLKPVGRTLAEFRPLYPGEKKLLKACQAGNICALGTKCPKLASHNNTIRASFIRFLALGGDEKAPVHEHGVQLLGAWIEGALDLNGTTLPVGLSLTSSNFSITPTLHDAQVHGTLNLSGSIVPGIWADRALIKGAVFLNDLSSNGEIRLLGAQIGGSLDCIDSKFDGKDGIALSADGAVINGDVTLRSGFSAVGEVRLLGALIGGNLDCADSKFDGKDSNALSADGAVIKGSVIFKGVSASGSVRLPAAQIGSDLNCIDAKLDGTDDNALTADRAVIKGSVFLTDGFSAIGKVRLLNVQIGGILNCNDAKFDGKNGSALSADRAVIKGSVFLRGFSASGEVRLLGALIGSDLNCINAKFDGKNSDALSVDGADIKGNVNFNNGFSANGEVRLLGAQIGGNLNCTGARFDGKDSNALSADGAVIKGSVFLSDGFSAIGKVRLLGAQIGGDLNCSKGKFDGEDRGALSADGAVIEGGLFLRHLSKPISRISLNHARVGRLIDDQNAWGDRLTLDGFVYGSLAGGAPIDAASRLAWLDKQRAKDSGLNGIGKDFRPQPWRQLQKILHEMGHAEEARQVAIAFDERLRKVGLIGQTTKPEWHPSYWLGRPVKICFHWLFGKLIGYGYRPLLLANWMLAIWLSCAAFYWYTALHGVFAPSNPLVFQDPVYSECMQDSNPAKKKSWNLPVPNEGNWYLCSKLTEEYTGFSPMAYSLDILLPLVDLQQQQDWAPLIPTPSPNWDIEIISFFDLKHLTRLVIWFEILFGWVSSLLLVAVVSGLTKRRED